MAPLCQSDPEFPSSQLPPRPRPAPRDVSSVELLLKYHQGIKSEINTRAKNFSTCLELGESLLQRQHQASEEVSPFVSLSPLFLARQLLGGAWGELLRNLPFTYGASGLPVGRESEPQQPVLHRKELASH